MILLQSVLQIFHLPALGPMFLWVGIVIFKLIYASNNFYFYFNFYPNVTFAESGMPCEIAFSNSEIRDIYVIPVACGMMGKLLLTEKHPFRSRHGVVIAIAPLAGLRVSQYSH